MAWAGVGRGGTVWSSVEVIGPGQWWCVVCVWCGGVVWCGVMRCGVRRGSAVGWDGRVLWHGRGVLWWRGVWGVRVGAVCGCGAGVWKRGGWRGAAMAG